jgi:hypothetical protein
MEVVITDQSLTHLEESLHFYITELEMPVEMAIEIKDTLHSPWKSGIRLSLVGKEPRQAKAAVFYLSSEKKEMA